MDDAAKIELGHILDINLKQQCYMSVTNNKIIPQG